MRLVTQLWTDRRGVTAVEYGIMAALIAVALVAAVATLGGGLSTAFSNVTAAMRPS